MVLLTSRQNPRVKYLRRLQRRSFRERERRFLVEGIKLIEEAFRAGWPLEAVVYTQHVWENERGAAVLRAARERQIPLWETTAPIFKEVATTPSPQGVLAVAAMRAFNPENGLDGRCPLVVIVDGFQDPGNLGTVIRTAHAVAATGVFLFHGTVDVYHPRAVRASAGSIFHIPVVYVKDDDSLFSWLRQRGITTFACDVRGEVPLWECDLKRPAAVILGGEAAGTRPELLAKADYRVCIPMPGGTESLNAAVAGAIFLFESVRQRLKTSLCSD